MKYFVIPDVHLKVGLVARIERLWDAGVADMRGVLDVLV